MELIRHASTIAAVIVVLVMSGVFVTSFVVCYRERSRARHAARGRHPAGRRLDSDPPTEPINLAAIRRDAAWLDGTEPATEADRALDLAFVYWRAACSEGLPQRRPGDTLPRFERVL